MCSSDLSSATLPTVTGTALTGSPCGLAAAVGAAVAAWGEAAGFAASALDTSGFGLVVVSFFEPQPAPSAAVTKAVKIVTLRMVGVCTTSLWNSGRRPCSEPLRLEKKIIASDENPRWQRAVGDVVGSTVIPAAFFADW